jgi:hypothetical protein
MYTKSIIFMFVFFMLSCTANNYNTEQVAKRLDKVDFENYKNMLFFYRGTDDTGSPHIFVGTAGWQTKGFYIVTIDENKKNIKSMDKKLLKVGGTISDAFIDTMALHFWNMRIPHLSVDGVGNVFVDLKLDNHEDLLYLKDSAAIPLKELSKWKIIYKNWYEYKD